MRRLCARIRRSSARGWITGNASILVGWVSAKRVTHRDHATRWVTLAAANPPYGLRTVGWEMARACAPCPPHLPTCAPLPHCTGNLVGSRASLTQRELSPPYEVM